MPELSLDALTAAMAMVPMLYSRNRMFALFQNAVVRRARMRARMVRGLLRFVCRDDVAVTCASSAGRVLVEYRIARLRLARTVQLTEFEMALLRVLVAKNGRATTSDVLREDPHDRARVDAALALLPKDEVRSPASEQDP